MNIRLDPGRVLSFSLVPMLVIRFIIHISTVSLHIKVNLIISVLILAIAHSKDVAIRIDSIHSVEVYKFPHMIGVVPTMISGQNRPNETPYPKVCDLRCPYNSTTAS